MNKRIVTALGLGVVASALATSTAFAAPKPHSLSYPDAKAYCSNTVAKPTGGPKALQGYTARLASCIKLYAIPGYVGSDRGKP